MRKIDRLIKSAKESIEFRGHKMRPFTKGKEMAYYVCDDCFMSVRVNPNPAPNECEIMGEAVAMTCDKKVGRK